MGYLQCLQPTGGSGARALLWLAQAAVCCCCRCCCGRPLNGSAPLRSVLRRSPEWVGMEQAMSSEENSKKRMIPWVEAGAKVPRLHASWGSQNSADMTPELPSDLGSSRRKNWGLALPTPNFAGEW